MKITFLDIDGVVNHELFYKERHRKRIYTFNHWWWMITSKIEWVFNGFQHKPYTLKASKKFEDKWARFEYRLKRFKEETDIVRLRWLDELCRDTGAKIVMTATMRGDFTIEEWNKVFACLKLENMELVGITGWDRENRIRGYEIQAYLDEHKNEIEDFVIIDDDSDFLESQLNNFFPTDAYSGLTPSILYRIKRHFAKESKYLCGVSISKNHL